MSPLRQRDHRGETRSHGGPSSDDLSEVVTILFPMSTLITPGSNIASPRRAADRRLNMTICSYNRTAATYSRRVGPADLGIHRLKFYESMNNRVLPVLDAGCGSGRD